MNPSFRLSTGLLVALVALAACGGGGGGGAAASDPDTGPGQAALSIEWPSRGRSVPLAANSVALAILKAGKTIRSGLAVRPSDGSPSVISFANLPLGTFDVRMSSFASVDGTGTALAVGTMPITPIAGAPTPVAVSMDPIVASLKVSTSTLSVPQTAAMGLTLSALDAAGTALLFSADAVKWTSDAPSIATVAWDGTTATVTGLTVGATTLHVTLTRPDGTVVTANVRVTVSGTGGSVTVR